MKPIRIRTNILLHIVLLLVIIVGALLGLQYIFSQELATQATQREFRHIAQRLGEHVHDSDRANKEKLELIAQYAQVMDPVGAGVPQAYLRLLSRVMEQNSNIYALYTGHGDGALFELVNMQSAPDTLRVFSAPEQTRWMLIKVYAAGENRVRTFDFFDGKFIHLGYRAEPSEYDATNRPWYRDALRSSKAVRTDPYRFANLKQMGFSYVLRVDDSDTVLAMDYTTRTLEQMLQNAKFDATSQIHIYGRDGTAIASSEPGAPMDDALMQAVSGGQEGVLLRYREQGRDRFGMVLPISSELGQSTQVGFSVDAMAMLRPYYEKMLYAAGVAATLLLLFIPLTLWMTSRIVRPIFEVMAENRKVEARRFEEVRQVETNIVELHELSASLLQMSESIRAYQRAQKELMDAFIKLIADAIDAKSPYTGGHCKRVPVIAMMLAEAAEAQREGVFADFTMGGKDDWEAFERGAWLHDCGKITTPEYVVDKATKLETLYNRIHEVRTRFEVIRRDIEIAFYERLLAGEARGTLEAWKTQEQSKLFEDFAFIAAANLGSEFMDAADQDRIRRIASRTWVRHFDDRAGLSDSELLRYEGVAPVAVPHTENLLDDKPEHRIDRVGFDEEAFRAQGFKIPVPDLLYDLGEIYNLCVQKGTLTDEERFKINEHVIMSIKMLEALPLLGEMARIPEYAGTHHETLDGTGYPRRLDAKALCIPARITAIADIFEALTASDRPYKKGKTLSQSLAIMARMVKDGQLDRELFILFLRGGLHLQYAKRYLNPEQIDDIVIEDYL